MKLLTRNTDYAIRAVSYMAKDTKRIISVSELVDALDTPRPFLRKLLQLLSKKGIVISHKGVGGGFELCVEPKKILLLDLVEIFQGRLKVNECLFKKSLCPNIAKCALKKRIDKIESYVTSELKSVSVEDLIN